MNDKEARLREPKEEEAAEEEVFYTDGANVYTVRPSDHQLVPTDQVEPLFLTHTI